MKKLLILAAASEALAGLILLVAPSIAIGLLFDSEIGGAGILMSRIAGISLIALGVACWPVPNPVRALIGMVTYSSLAMLYLAYLGINGRVGILLWPAVAAHSGLTVLLVLAWRKERRAPTANA
jgi:hypothetical protein